MLLRKCTRKHSGRILFFCLKMTTEAERLVIKWQTCFAWSLCIPGLLNLNFYFLRISYMSTVFTPFLPNIHPSNSSRVPLLPVKSMTSSLIIVIVHRETDRQQTDRHMCAKRQRLPLSPFSVA